MPPLQPRRATTDHQHHGKVALSVPWNKPSAEHPNGRRSRFANARPVATRSSIASVFEGGYQEGMTPTEPEGVAQCFDKCASARGRRARPGSVRGLSRTLLDLLGRQRIAGRTVLEVGCGLGGLTLASASRGAVRATGVDLSPVAIREASRLAAEAGLADRVTFAVGDGSRMDLAPHDVVVLDKVICCYPDVDALLDNSLRATRLAYGFVVPFSSGWRGVLARAGIAGENGLRRMRKRPFRAFVHDIDRIEARIAEAGLKRVATAGRFVWYLAVYTRHA